MFTGFSDDVITQFSKNCESIDKETLSHLKNSFSDVHKAWFNTDFDTSNLEKSLKKATKKATKPAKKSGGTRERKDITRLIKMGVITAGDDCLTMKYKGEVHIVGLDENGICTYNGETHQSIGKCSVAIKQANGFGGKTTNPWVDFKHNDVLIQKLWNEHIKGIVEQPKPKKTPKKAPKKTPKKEIEKTPKKEVEKAPKKEIEKTPKKEVEKSEPKAPETSDPAKTLLLNMVKSKLGIELPMDTDMDTLQKLLNSSDKSQKKEVDETPKEEELNLDDFDMEEEEEETQDEVEEIEHESWGTIYHNKTLGKYFNEECDELVLEDGEFVEKED